MNKKGVKTSIVAFTILTVSIGLIVALVFEKLTATNFGIAMSSVATIGVTVIGWFAKDANQSHTHDQKVGEGTDPDKEEK